MIAAVAVLLLLAALTGAVVLANRLNAPRYGGVPFIGATKPGAGGAELHVVTWNIGYGSLGAGADFIADGGRSIRALGRGSIATATEAIGETLVSLDTDLFLLQEVAAASFATRGIDVKGGVHRALGSHCAAFWEDFATTMLPPPFNISNGMMILSRVAADRCSARALPQEPGFRFGMLKKHYGVLLTRIPTGAGGEWAILNVHLSAFDDGGRVRARQVAALLEMAEAEYRRGAHVVIGGDWNMRLVESSFPHDTEKHFLSWIHDFPHEAVPEGWTFAADPSVPSVRTLHRPYQEGVNYVTVVDGFLVSPNVAIDQIETSDLAFLHTDHHPVKVSVRMTG